MPQASMVGYSDPSPMVHNWLDSMADIKRDHLPMQTSSMAMTRDCWRWRMLPTHFSIRMALRCLDPLANVDSDLSGIQLCSKVAYVGALCSHWCMGTPDSCTRGRLPRSSVFPTVSNIHTHYAHLWHCWASWPLLSRWCGFAAISFTMSTGPLDCPFGQHHLNGFVLINVNC